jgi:hypothetical protein
MKLYYKIKNKINSYFLKPAIIPDYETKRALLKEKKEKYGLNILVETGTFMGETVEYFKDIFASVFSIELSDELAKKAQGKFKNDKNVKIIQGDSADVLQKLLKEISEPALFWLDGHYSSEFFVGDEFIKTAKGRSDTPVKEELRSILQSSLNHIILIDDARLFTGLNDYPSVSKLKQMVKRSGKKYSVSVENDIIRILPI